MPADDDGNGSLHRRGREADRHQGVELTFERYRFLGPQPAHDDELLVESSTTRGEIHSQGVEFGVVPPDPDAQSDSPATQHVVDVCCAIMTALVSPIRRVTAAR